MKKGNHSKRSFKGLALILALVLIFGAVVGGTVAWLTDETPSITNTFSPTDIEVGLTESKSEFQIIPGVNITKDPTVTYESDVDCYVFVEVEESGNFGLLEYEIAAPWQSVPGVANVYYFEVTGVEANAPANGSCTVLKNNTVTVSKDITKEQMEALGGDITLTFTAYAIQKAGFGSVAAAWAEVSK